jgi:hypothetical protein
MSKEKCGCQSIVLKPNIVIHTYNPSTGEVGGSEFETSLDYRGRLHLEKTTTTKLLLYRQDFLK